MKSLRYLCLCFTLLSLLLTGCNQGSRKTTVAFVTNNNAEFWTIGEVGALEAGEKFGVDVIVKKPDVAGVSGQKKIIDPLLIRGIDALGLSVFDPENQVDYIDKIGKDIPVVAFDNDAEKSKKRLCYIGTDNFSAGQEVGKLVKEAIPDGGIVVIFVGQIQPINAQRRWKGVLKEVFGTTDSTKAETKKYELFGEGPQKLPFTDDAKPDVAKKKADYVVGLLSKKIKAGRPVCMVGLWAYNPPAIMQALRPEKLLGTVKIVAMDEDRETLKGIKKGWVHGTVVQDPYKFGYETVRVLASLAKGDKKVLDGPEFEGDMKKYYIPHRTFRQNNVDELKAEVEDYLKRAPK